MATKTKTPTATSNLNADQSGEPIPVPVPASDGKTVDEMATKPSRRLSVAAKVAKVGKLATEIMRDRGREAKIQLQIAAKLLTAEPLFIGEDGKPGTLPIPGTGIDGEPIVSDLSFYDWTEQACRLNYSSTRQYLQAARFGAAHPGAAAKVESVKAAAVMEAAATRKPEAVQAILADLPEGATIAAVEAAVAKHAPKVSKPKKVQDTSKVQTALEAAARDEYWKHLSQATSGMEAAQIVAVQDLCAEVAKMATDPSIGKGSAVFTLAISQLSGEWNRQREEAAARRADQAAKQAKRTK